MKECSNFLIKDHSAVPLTLALEAAELIHVTQYKALMQTKKHVKRKIPYSKSKVNSFFTFTTRTDPNPDPKLTQILWALNFDQNPSERSG